MYWQRYWKGIMVSQNNFYHLVEKTKHYRKSYLDFMTIQGISTLLWRDLHTRTCRKLQRDIREHTEVEKKHGYSFLSQNKQKKTVGNRMLKKSYLPPRLQFKARRSHGFFLRHSSAQHLWNLKNIEMDKVWQCFLTADYAIWRRKIHQLKPCTQCLCLIPWV